MNIPHNIEAERALLHHLIFEAIEPIHYCPVKTGN